MLLNIFLRVELLDHRECMCAIQWTLFSKVYQVTLNESVHSSISSSMLGITRLSSGYIVVFDFAFPDYWWAEHTFMCLLVILILSDAYSNLLHIFPFSHWVFFIFLNDLCKFLQFVYINFLLVICVVNMCLPFHS